MLDIARIIQTRIPDLAQVFGGMRGGPPLHANRRTPGRLS